MNGKVPPAGTRADHALGGHDVQADPLCPICASEDAEVAAYSKTMPGVGKPLIALSLGDWQKALVAIRKYEPNEPLDEAMRQMEDFERIAAEIKEQLENK